MYWYIKSNQQWQDVNDIFFSLAMSDGRADHGSGRLKGGSTPANGQWVYLSLNLLNHRLIWNVFTKPHVPNEILRYITKFGSSMFVITSHCDYFSWLIIHALLFPALFAGSYSLFLSWVHLKNSRGSIDPILLGIWLGMFPKTCLCTCARMCIFSFFVFIFLFSVYACLEVPSSMYGWLYRSKLRVHVDVF